MNRLVLCIFLCVWLVSSQNWLIDLHLKPTEANSSESLYEVFESILTKSHLFRSNCTNNLHGSIQFITFISKDIYEYSTLFLLYNSPYFISHNIILSVFSNEDSYSTDYRWNKVKLLHDSLLTWARDCSYIVYLDADILFLDIDYNLTAILNQAPQMDLYLAEDRLDYANTGVIILRNSPLSLTFIQSWWQGQFACGNCYCDQHVLNKLSLNPETGMTAEHVAILPYYYLNSYWSSLEHRFWPILHLLGEYDLLATPRQTAGRGQEQQGKMMERLQEELVDVKLRAIRDDYYHIEAQLTQLVSLSLHHQEEEQDKSLGKLQGYVDHTCEMLYRHLVDYNDSCYSSSSSLLVPQIINATCYDLLDQFSRLLLSLQQRQEGRGWDLTFDLLFWRLKLALAAVDAHPLVPHYIDQLFSLLLQQQQLQQQQQQQVFPASSFSHSTSFLDQLSLQQRYVQLSLLLLQSYHSSQQGSRSYLPPCSTSEASFSSFPPTSPSLSPMSCLIQQAIAVSSDLLALHQQHLASSSSFLRPLFLSDLRQHLSLLALAASLLLPSSSSSLSYCEEAVYLAPIYRTGRGGGRGEGKGSEEQQVKEEERVVMNTLRYVHNHCKEISLQQKLHQVQVNGQQEEEEDEELKERRQELLVAIQEMVMVKKERQEEEGDGLSFAHYSPRPYLTTREQGGREEGVADDGQ